MRVFKLILIGLAFQFSLFAESNHIKMQEIMLNLENGINDVQKGFLYNSIDLIEDGIKQILKENKIYKNKNEVIKIIPKDKRQMLNAAVLTSLRIDNSAKAMIEYLKMKKMKNAYDSFSEIVKACTDCHAIIRNW